MSRKPRARIIRITPEHSIREGDQLGAALMASASLTKFLISKVCEAYDITPSQLPLGFYVKAVNEMLPLILKSMVEKK